MPGAIASSPVKDLPARERAFRDDYRTYHDMALNGLYDIGKEAFALRDESVLPHLVCDQADKVCGEEDPLVVRKIRIVRCGDLEALYETFKNIPIKRFAIEKKADLFFGQIFIMRFEAHSVMSNGGRRGRNHLSVPAYTIPFKLCPKFAYVWSDLRIRCPTNLD
jgi:hypothetical protein